MENKMERKSVLGRGLDALIPSSAEAPKERVQMIKIDQIFASKYQPRLHFSEEKIEELAKSIKEKGVIQPVLVRQNSQDRYELIAGERRLRATRSLGMSEIPAIVRRVADADLLELSIIENVQREELNSIEEAKAYQRLAQEFGYTQDSIAAKVGKDKSSISNLLRLLSLPIKVQDFISQNLITFGHARALIPIQDEKRQLLFCEKIVQNGLSVRQVELMISPTQKNRSLRPRTQDRDIKALEDKLQYILKTKVRVKHGKKRGKIEIEYYSLDDLDRVLKLMGAYSSS